ncbi:hypothetical protein [Dyadobacter sp. CY261]|nr:hypothetical protein [Dyadobacter sp. CY261]
MDLLKLASVTSGYPPALVEYEWALREDAERTIRATMFLSYFFDK